MHFDDEARKWDTEDKIQLAKIISDEMKKSVNMNEYKNALEFGCGTGLIGFNLLEYFDHMTLIDSSEGMIQVLNEKIKSSGILKIEGELADIYNDTSWNKTFDFIFSSLSLHHVLDTKLVLKKLYESLEDGGEVCIVELDTDDGSFHRHISNYDGHDGFDQKEFSRKFEEAGFKNVEAKTFYKATK